MKSYKTLMLATATVALLGTGFIKPAEAFDNVTWNWNATMTENINESVNVGINVNPSGLTQIEQSQKMIGNISAKSQVSHVANNPPVMPNGVDLPELSSVGTAVGNNQSIESIVSMNMDDHQYMKGNISATSEVAHILNASVEGAATAVGNNMDIKLDAVTPGDAMVIADVMQYTKGNLSSTSKVSHVQVNGYANMNAVTVPMVDSSATSVGNNFALKVTVPTL